MDVPKDKNFPRDSVQCGVCNGKGCGACSQRGWLIPSTHPRGRKCKSIFCEKPLLPGSNSGYCNAKCANDNSF